jgi:hypothetical protein
VDVNIIATVTTGLGILGGVYALVNRVEDRINRRIDEHFHGVDSRFRGIDQRFDAINTRFDDMRDLWRSELHRVEQVLDARLSHLENEK